MKVRNLIYIGTILLATLISACSSEEQECSANDFVGTWQVKQNICPIHSSPTVSISEGTGSSRIELNLDTDTIPFLILDCMASHKSSDFLTAKEVTITLNNEELEIEYRSQVAILPTFCTLVLTK
jgi:hypothetical protein